MYMNELNFKVIVSCLPFKLLVINWFLHHKLSQAYRRKICDRSPQHFRISDAEYIVSVSIVSLICRHFVTKLQELHQLCLKKVKNSLVASLYKKPLE